MIPAGNRNHFWWFIEENLLKALLTEGVIGTNKKDEALRNWQQWGNVHTFWAEGVRGESGVGRVKWAEILEKGTCVCVCCKIAKGHSYQRCCTEQGGWKKKKVTVTFLCPLALRSPIITFYWLNSTRSQPAGVPTEAKHIHQSSSSQGRVEKHENISGG